MSVNVTGLREGHNMTTTAWLIERDDVQLCLASPLSSGLGWVTFTDLLAWRFESQEAAERHIRDHNLTGVRATEHSWS